MPRKIIHWFCLFAAGLTLWPIKGIGFNIFGWNEYVYLHSDEGNYVWGMASGQSHQAYDGQAWEAYPAEGVMTYEESWYQPLIETETITWFLEAQSEPFRWFDFLIIQEADYIGFDFPGILWFFILALWLVGARLTRTPTKSEQTNSD